MLKKKINKVFIALTPFHKNVIMHLFSEEIKEENTLMFLGEYVTSEDITCEIRYLKNFNFSKRKISENPFKFFKKARFDIHEIKKTIEKIKNKYCLSNDLKIYSGTDKDIFVQLFLEFIFKELLNPKLILIEEGVGYYLKVNLKDKIISIIYALLTPILFGSRLYYIKKLGSYPKIDTIFIRYLYLLKKKNKKINYVEFKLNNQTNKRLNKKNSILLYSFPDQDNGLSLEKFKVISEIANFLYKHNKELIIKPHPREDVKELKKVFKNSSNVTILNNSFSGEELNYFDFELIINFFSSVLLDILDKDYPKRQIITIGFSKKPIIHFENKLRYYYIRNFKASKFITFEKNITR